MDTDHYVAQAVTLVNSPLGDVDDVRALLGERSWLLELLSPSDIRPLRRLQGELAQVVDASARGDQQEVVDLLNAALLRHPVRPRISGHGAPSWHLHVNDRDASASEVLAAESLYGLTLLVTTLGADRLGRCAAEGCDRAFVDVSTAGSKRFCSSRCATRTNVAAYRARQQAAS